MLANESLSDLEASLSNVYEITGRPECMLAIYRHESQELHCNLVVYLTSQLQRVTKLEDAVSCKIPPLFDSGFLAGNKTYLNKIKYPNN